MTYPNSRCWIRVPRIWWCSARILLTFWSTGSKNIEHRWERIERNSNQRLKKFAVVYHLLASTSSSKLKFSVCSLKPEPWMISTKLEATPVACTVVCLVNCRKEHQWLPSLPNSKAENNSRCSNFAPTSLSQKTKQMKTRIKNEAWI